MTDEEIREALSIIDREESVEVTEKEAGLFETLIGSSFEISFKQRKWALGIIRKYQDKSPLLAGIKLPTENDKPAVASVEHKVDIETVTDGVKKIDAFQEKQVENLGHSFKEANSVVKKTNDMLELGGYKTRFPEVYVGELYDSYFGRLATAIVSVERERIKRELNKKEPF